MNDIKWFSFETKYFLSYKRFARQQFGMNCYQVSDNYINWLYQENPCAKSDYKDFIIGVLKGQKVIGCHHKMRLEWKVGERIIEIPTLADLMVCKKHRHGTGLMAIMIALKGEDHALIPAAARHIADIYEGLKLQKIQTRWYRKLLNPFEVAVLFGLNRVFNYQEKRASFLRIDEERKINNCKYQITTSPSNEVMEKIVLCLNNDDEVEVAPRWNIDTFRWRYFHPIGPKHLLIYTGSHEIEDFIILSLGPLHGLNLARVVTLRASSYKKFESLVMKGKGLAKKYGGSFLSLFSADSTINDMFKKNSWSHMTRPPVSFFYHRDKNLFSSYSFTGEALDYGFEAIPKDQQM